MRRGRKSAEENSPRARGGDSEESWRDSLKEVVLNDEIWWCMVSMMVETRSTQARCVSLFNKAAEGGKRKAIYPLSFRRTLASLRAASKQALGSCPSVQAVCHYAVRVLNERDGLPAWLMAQVIKYLVYRAREESVNVGNRLKDLEREIDEEYCVMRTEAKWDHTSVQKRGVPYRKANTKLRRRDEEWRDTVYVDDAPIKGPNLYVILSGFHDPDLPRCLIEAGVSLHCILRIERPDEGPAELVVSEDPAERALRFLEDYTVSDVTLANFWNTVDACLDHPDEYPEYCDVGFVTFCPPEYPSELWEDEARERDIYDRVSFVLYDFYDRYRQHGNYLRGMRVENCTSDGLAVSEVGEIYRGLLDSFPEECVTVPVILFAILAQVEAWEDLRTSSDQEEPAISGSKLTQHPLITFIDSPVESHQGKPIEIPLTLHGDSLQEAIRLQDVRTLRRIPRKFQKNLLNEILCLLLPPVVLRLQQRHRVPEEKLLNYSRHLDNLRRFCYDRYVTEEQVRHHLHVTAFGKLILGAEKQPEERSSEMERPVPPSRNLQRAQSLPSTLDREWGPPTRFLSDSAIHYGRAVPELAEYGSLFTLLDPRGLVLPGFLDTDAFITLGEPGVSLEGFSDVELLSKSVFLQLLNECQASFGRLVLRYFEPTDSLLLYMANDWPVGSVLEEGSTTSIRTPVRLRDFCRYVVPEEEDWLRSEEESHKLEISGFAEKPTRRSTVAQEGVFVFGDEDFVRPGSLKARELYRAISSRESQKGMKMENREEKREHFIEKLGRDESLITERTAASIVSNKLSEICDFVGYDLGRLRVQISHRRKTFSSADGTLVHVEIDDWLYGSKDVRVTCTLRGCSLRLSHRIAGPEVENVFHFTSTTGIIMAFGKLAPVEGETFPADNNNWANMDVGFRASWPTGLLIEPIIADGPENSYYIQQSYVPKGCDSVPGEVREISRKFLRNGTVLIYLENGQAIVLRSNGVIVNCKTFERQGTKKEEGDVPKIFGSTENVRGKSARIPSKVKAKATGSLHRLSGSGEGGIPVHRKPATKREETSARSSTLRVSRYTVTDHDGRQYEAADDEIILEQRRLFVRTTSDYEVDEKFIRRSDGTDALLKSSGELIVQFPDDTRITTAYVIEDNPVVCDWSAEEVSRYFKPGETDEEEETTAGNSFPDCGTNIAEMTTSDGFVSVLLTCRVEHKNYATVAYDQLTGSCTLSMPEDLRISMSSAGQYEVSMSDGVNLKIDKDGLSFKGNQCALCSNQSTCEYSLRPAGTPSTILIVRDVFGNEFTLKNSGETTFKAATISPSEIQEAIPKDLSTREEAEMTADLSEKSSLRLYNGNPPENFQRLVAFAAAGATSRARRALSSPVGQLRPRNFDRKQVLRSTYSTPYDWVFPFGRVGNGVRETTHDRPLIDDSAALPDLLEVRVLRGFRSPAGSALLEFQRALKLYWTAVVHGVAPEEVARAANERDDLSRESEDELRNLSLGVKRTIDAETYRIGLESCRNAVRGAPGTSRSLAEFCALRAVKNEHLEWYRRCVDEKFVLPYFSNACGACFLLVMDCLERAVMIAWTGSLRSEEASID